MKFLVLLLFIGCASQNAAQHFVGTFTSSSDQIINGRNGQSGRVEATFEQHDTTAILHVHFLDDGRFDTLIFHFSDSAGWRWSGEQRWKSTIHWPATIRQTADSVYVSFGWGYGGESFYLKQDSK